MNKVILMGRLTRDPDMRGEGTDLCAKYNLAVDRRFKREGQESADFISCVTFGKGAEFAERYLKKGTKVCVCGRIQTGSYERDGKKIYTTDVVVEEHYFTESKGSSAGTAEKSSDSDFMDIPTSVIDDMPF